MTLEVGLATWMSDVDRVIARCKQLDVNSVTMRVASMQGFEKNRAPDRAALREMQGRLADAGITIAALSQWFGDDAALVVDPASHRREVDGMLQTLDVQGELGISRQLHYVDVPEPADPAEDDLYWSGMLEIFREAETSRGEDPRIMELLVISGESNNLDAVESAKASLFSEKGVHYE